MRQVVKKTFKYGICVEMALIWASPSWAASKAIPISIQVSSPTVSVSTEPSGVVPVAVVEPFVSPLGKGKAKIISGFGKRKSPTDATKMESHEGVDFVITPGDSVRAARSGKVLFAGFSKSYVSRADKTDQMHLIILHHADGKSSRYVHLNSIRVKPMQQVQAGDILGTAGESDEWNVPVLHFEIRMPNGKAVDPKPYLMGTK